MPGPPVGAKFSDGLRTGQILNSRNSGSIISPEQQPPNYPIRLKVQTFGRRLRTRKIFVTVSKQASAHGVKPVTRPSGSHRTHFRWTIQSLRQERHILQELLGVVA